MVVMELKLTLQEFLFTTQVAAVALLLMPVLEVEAVKAAEATAAVTEALLLLL